MDFNQNQDLNNQFKNNNNQQQNASPENDMQQPLNQNPQAGQVQIVASNPKQNQEHQKFQPQPQPLTFNIHVDLNNKEIFNMQPTNMPKMMEGLFQNLYHHSIFTKPEASEIELQQELDKLQNSVDKEQHSNLILELKLYLTKFSYKKYIPNNISYCVKALGILKGGYSVIALQEAKKKIDDDTNMLFSDGGNVLVCLTCMCCLCCFMLCILMGCKNCGNFRQPNYNQVQELKKLIDQNIALCENKQI